MYFGNLLNLRIRYFAGIVVFLLTTGTCAYASEQQIASPENAESESQIMKKFTANENKDSELITISDQRKRQVMFAMGVPLLLFILITVVLGISMGVFGKTVYVAHMIFAGLSLTLALGHAIVGLVWFWPF